MSQNEAARRLGVDKSTVSEWGQRYRAKGSQAFQKQEYHTVYPEEQKIKAVRESILPKQAHKKNLQHSTDYGQKGNCIIG